MKFSVFLALAALPVFGAPEILNFHFGQIDYTPPSSTHSGLARISISITLDPDQVWYLNAVQPVGAGWFIPNLPILSASQAGVSNLTFNTVAPIFQDGMDAAGQSFPFLFTVTPDPIPSPPSNGAGITVTIGRTTFVSNNGVQNPIAVTPPGAIPNVVTPPAESAIFTDPGLIRYSQREAAGQGLSGAASTDFLYFAAIRNFNLGLTPPQVLSTIHTDMGGGSAGFSEMSALSGIVGFGVMQSVPAQYSYWGGGGTASGALPTNVAGITLSQEFVPNMGPVTFDSIRTALSNGTLLSGISVGPSEANGFAIAGAAQVEGQNGSKSDWVYYLLDHVDGSGNSTGDYNSIFALPFSDASSPTGFPTLGNGYLTTMMGILPVPNATPGILTSGVFSNNPGPPSGGGCNALAPFVNAFSSNTRLSGIFFASGLGSVTSANFYEDASFPNLPAQIETGYVLVGNNQEFGVGGVTENPASPGTPESLNLGITLGTGANACTLNSNLVQVQSQATDAQTSAAHDGEPISALTGEVTQEPPPDLALGGPAQLEFRRYYGSLLGLNHITGTLGGNWMSNFDVQAYVSSPSASVSTFRGGIVRFAAAAGGAWVLSGTYSLDYQFQSVSGGAYQFLDPATNLIYTFNHQGKLTSIADRNGNTLTVTQGTSGPTAVSDGLGRTLSMTYTGSNLTGVRDQTGRSISFAYGGGGSSLVSFTDANGKTTAYTYTAAGSLTSLLSKTVQPVGNTLFSQTFDSTGRAVTQSDGNGNVSSLAYSANVPGQTAFSDPAGNTWIQSHPNLLDYTGSTDPSDQYTSTDYNVNGRPISVVDRNGNTSLAAYDSNSGYLASRTNAENETTSYSYSQTQSSGFKFYDLSAIQFPDGTSTTFTRDAAGNLLTRTDAAGNVTRYSYNVHGQPLTVTNPLGGVTTLTYNADATVATSTSPANNKTSYSYDGLKRLNKITFADGTTQSYTFDPLDRLTSATDELGKVITYAYTGNGDLASVTDALNSLTSYSYDADGNQSQVATPAGATTISYNAVSQVSKIQAPTGETRSYSYDKLNRVAAATDATAQVAAYSYDNEDNLTSIKDGANRVTQFGLDRAGRVLTTTTPLSETWSTSFNKLGNAISQSDPLGNTTAYSYDANGRLSGISGPGASSATYTYDAFGDLSSITDPNGNVWANHFDNMGRETSSADPLGQSVNWTYDTRDRSAIVSNSLGSGNLTHDAAGNLTGVSYSDGTQLNYTYDANRRLTGASGATLTIDSNGKTIASNGIAMTRDASERITKIAYPPGSVTYAYNSRGLPSQITDWTGATTTFTYDASLRLTGILRANGVTTTYSYDGDGRLAGINDSLSGSTLMSNTLTRDAAGNVVASARSQPQSPAPAAGVSSNTYNAADEVNGSSYDSLGRLTADSVRTYSWDLASRLKAYTGQDGAAAFTYDGFGTRISRTSQGVTENFLVLYAFPLPVIAVAKNGSTDQRYYIYTPNGNLLYAIDAGGSVHHYYHFDESGNTIALTDNSGAITDSFGITPFGESVVHKGATPNVFTWQGEFGVMQEPGTSLYYLNARYYDSSSARFLSRDQLKGAAPLRIDPYSYAADNPVTLTDPSGLDYLHTAALTLPSNFFGTATGDPYANISVVSGTLLTSAAVVTAQSGKILNQVEKTLLTYRQLQTVGEVEFSAFTPKPDLGSIPGLEQQAQGLQNVSTALTAVGTAIQVATIAVDAVQLSNDIDQANTTYDKFTSQADAIYAAKLKRLKKQFQSGQLGSEEYHRLQKEALRENQESADAAADGLFTDLGIAGTTFVENSLSTFTPIPPEAIQATSRGVAGTPK